MFESYLLSRPWLVAAIWAVLYASDYYLTIWGAKLREAQSVWGSGDSYELTPRYQKDIDRKRLVSPRFVILLVCASVVLIVMGHTTEGSREGYGFLVGVFLLPELLVHKRHLSNILFFKEILRSNSSVSGMIRVKRHAVYRQSATEFAAYAVISLLLFAVADSYILLGGAFVLGILACQQFGYARREKRKATPIPQDAAD